MDNKSRKDELRGKQQKMLAALIILLIALFILMIFSDRNFSKKIRHRKVEEWEIRKYDGSLNRNLANPIGSE